ncbi:MAG TPA: enoyl-CoA hydratase-related protein [Bacillota bacterium]
MSQSRWGSAVQTQQDNIVTITFNRPEMRNAMDLDTWIALGRELPTLAARDDVAAIVFTGAGTEAFAAGADIREFPERRMGSEQGRVYQEAVLAAIDAVLDCPKPTVAKIRGACVGGGLELASCCDLRVAADNARFGIPIARIGVLLGWREMQRLVQLVGPGITLDLLLTARLLDSEEALRVGLITHRVPGAELDAYTDRLLEAILAGSPFVHRAHKRMLNILLSNPTLQSLSEEEEALPLSCFDSDDYKEGIDAFVNKRRPRFKGS